MVRLLRKCLFCRRYTLSGVCPNCGKETAYPHPPKFSPDDKYIRYRVKDRYATGEGEGEGEGASQAQGTNS